MSTVANQISASVIEYNKIYTNDFIATRTNCFLLLSFSTSLGRTYLLVKNLFTNRYFFRCTCATHDHEIAHLHCMTFTAFIIFTDQFPELDGLIVLLEKLEELVKV